MLLYTAFQFILRLCDISVMSSRLTAAENKVTAITQELERTKAEQQLQKKKVEEAERLITGIYLQN